MKPLWENQRLTYVYRNEDYFYDQIIINGQPQDNHNLSIVDNFFTSLIYPNIGSKKEIISIILFDFGQETDYLEVIPIIWRLR